MNFEFNKIAGAVLGTALGVMTIGIVADMVYAPRVGEQPGYVIAVAEPGEGEDGPVAPQVLPIADRLQVASADTGQRDVAKCGACHTFEQGGPNKVGPNLWDTVGHNVVHGDFDYSDAMRERGEEGMTWTYENLDHFLENPRGFIPGTAMTFVGIRDPEERADIIAYLRTLSPEPVPLPAPTPEPTAEAPAETPPAAGENPPAGTESPPEVATPPAIEAPAPEPPPATEAPVAEPPAVEAPPATEAPAPAPDAPAPDQPAAETESPEGAPAPETPAP